VSASPRFRIDAQRLPALLEGMPKAELHIHIEGSLEPELIFEMARRNGQALAYPDVDALRAAYAFKDLQSFLDIYYAGASVLRTVRDFHDMAWAYLVRAAAQNVRRTEIFFDPQTHTDRGVAFGTVIEGLSQACERAARELGVDAALILCFLRHQSEQQAFEVLEQALPYQRHFIGVGLDSSERGHPPSKFERVFARCRALGLRPVAHAGEEGPPAYVREALDVLKVERIDHGVRCLEDPVLVAELARRRVPLTVCPLSNVKLRVFERLADHALGKMLDAGLCATVNSDDPAYFGGYLDANYTQTFAALGLSADHAFALACNGFEAAFVDAPSRRRHLDAVEDYFTRFA
jgi:adenosine deaminase